ncbi:hypothetical protein ACMSDS_11915 [Bacteroides thetaiotaomicron]|uniref:hypothetical protein n=1 Tax=Bacteroides thetaiotaomicron TaxID=818 RepID=UPI0039C3A5C0
MAKNCYSERLLSIIDSLDMTDAEIVKEIDSLDKTLMSHIRNGRQGASLNLISSFCERFPLIDANYILTGNGPMFKEEQETGYKQEALSDHSKKLFEEFNKQTRVLLAQRDEEIRELQLENARLKAEMNIQNVG